MVFTLVVLILATLTRSVADFAVSVTAAGLIAASTITTVINAWEIMWLFAWITMPWVFVFETPFMADEDLFAFRALYTAMCPLIVFATLALGIVHGRLLAVPWRVRFATGTIIALEMWIALHVRGIGASVGVPAGVTFYLAMLIGLYMHRNEQSLALVSADALTTHVHSVSNEEGEEASVHSDPDDPDAPLCGPAGSVASSGPFSNRSLWDGWSDVWSDPGVTYQQKLSRMVSRGLRFRSREEVQESVRSAKDILAKEEASKAMRRAEQHAERRAQLVWRLLLHGSQSPVACLPKDALRIIIKEWAKEETKRLERLYAHRLEGGATSYRG